ncbi:MAG: hypothetical protein N2C14_21710 [Planctomycetales bacterium]
MIEHPNDVAPVSRRWEGRTLLATLQPGRTRTRGPTPGPDEMNHQGILVENKVAPDDEHVKFVRADRLEERG